LFDSLAIPSQPILRHALQLPYSTVWNVRHCPRVAVFARSPSVATGFVATGLHHHAALGGVLPFDFTIEVVPSNELRPTFQSIVEAFP